MTKKRIMIADDDPAILDAMKMLLEEFGYHIEVTNNAHSVQEMTDQMPDLLLLDIWMSGVNGKDICKLLKSQEHTQRIPIIMVSANKDTQSIAAEAGADGFLTKPFSMDELLRKVADHV